MLIAALLIVAGVVALLAMSAWRDASMAPMTNEPISITTTETTFEMVEPAIPAVADLFSARTRTIIYLLSVMAAAAMGIVLVSVELHWGFLAAWASWNAFVGLVAVSNVNKPVHTI